MRAVVYSEYGPPDRLTVAEVPSPAPGAGEVLIAVRAASVNSWDWDLLRGAPVFIRLEAPFRPRHPILGADVAGVVEAVGEGVTRFRPGDRVFGDLSSGGWGGFAEQVAAPAELLAPIPNGVGFEAAAATPQAGLLAWQGLRWKRDVKPGDRVLVNGAGGGVGTFAIQLARLWGATVTGVDRAEKFELMRELGVERAIDYAAEDFTASGERYDLILDMVANRPVAHYQRALTPTGRLVVVGGKTGTLLALVTRGALASRAGGQQLGLLLHQPDAGQLGELGALIAAGHVTPVIDRTYRLEDAPEALRRIGAGQALGKLVVVP